MFKKFIIIILLTALSVRPAFYVGSMVYYETHINEIIEKYCVNTAKPELKCNGKCHLAKQISTLSIDDSSDVLVDVSNLFFPVYFQEIEQRYFFNKYFVVTNSYRDFKTNYQYLLCRYIDRPPIA